MSNSIEVPKTIKHTLRIMCTGCNVLIWDGNYTPDGWFKMGEYEVEIPVPQMSQEELTLGIIGRLEERKVKNLQTVTDENHEIDEKIQKLRALEYIPVVDSTDDDIPF